jgi:hypothetical protein
MVAKRGYHQSKYVSANNELGRKTVAREFAGAPIVSRLARGTGSTSDSGSAGAASCETLSGEFVWVIRRAKKPERRLRKTAGAEEELAWGISIHQIES